jgi:hypothetical protein
MEKEPTLIIDRSDIKDLTVELVAQNPIWTDLLEAFEAVMKANVEAPLQQLEKIRYLDPGTEQEILQKTVRMLGFNPTQDVLDMSSNNLTRLVTQLSLYPDYNSTILFEKFIDLLLNAVTTVEYLYTKDYASFYPYPLGPLITEGGPWYKSTHINLYVELLNPKALENSSDTRSVFKRILDVFYEFCPISLVVKDLFFTINYQVQYGYSAILLSPEIELTLDH